MRTALVPLLLAPLALAAPDNLAAFEPALATLDQLTTSNNDTTPIDNIAELLKRQNLCGNNQYQCSNAASLCCPRTAVCSADRNNVVGCCPQGAACTGTLGTSATGVATASTTSPFVSASTTSNFVQQTTAASGASTVSNAFYPFPYIATTYTNAAACSSAYTRCQLHKCSDRRRAGCHYQRTKRRCDDHSGAEYRTAKCSQHLLESEPGGVLWTASRCV
jgi:hypothetical protein